MGLLEVCACLLDHFELLHKLPLSHIGVKHVEQEETSIYIIIVIVDYLENS